MTEKAIELSAGPIRYRDDGSGSPLVFVHGLLVNGLLWRKVIPLLSGRYRCIVPDFPFGSHEQPMRSDADLSPPALAHLVSEFVEALNLEDVTLVGNDTGSALCQVVAADHPGPVARIVLTPGDAYEVFPPRRFLYLKWAAFLPDPALALLAQTMRFGPVLRSPIGFGAFTREPIERRILDSYVRPVRRNREIRRDAAKILRSVSARYTIDVVRRLRRFKGDILIAWAANDRLFSPSLAHRLAADLPRAQLEWIENARTFVSEDEPERLAELIEKFAA